MLEDASAADENAALEVVHIPLGFWFAGGDGYLPQLQLADQGIPRRVRVYNMDWYTPTTGGFVHKTPAHKE